MEINITVPGCPQRLQEYENLRTTKMQAKGDKYTLQYPYQYKRGE